MTKEEIIKYVLHTPENTNPAILGEMLDAYSGQSNSGSNTYNNIEIINMTEDDYYYVEDQSNPTAT